MTNTGASAVDRKPSAFNFTLDALPTFVEYGNEAKWGISGYLNSANIGRPNPSPANYGAPATFDAASGISTWGDGTVVSNDDRTVTVSFEGSSVNHAKTGGGWVRIADLEATLDESGNGTVSGVVSYGTMAPPSVFNPATPPVRGPERVDLVTLSGNSADARGDAGRCRLVRTQRRVERGVARLPRPATPRRPPRSRPGPTRRR